MPKMSCTPSLQEMVAKIKQLPNGPRKDELLNRIYELSAAQAAVRKVERAVAEMDDKV